MNEEYLQKLLFAKANNIYSQFGEDGIIAAIFEAIDTTNQWCLEVGAADGIWHSNTRHLIENGWKAVLIESNNKYKALCKNSSSNCYCVHTKIESEGENSLDTILDKLKAPKVLDLISIDIDGQEYHIWNQMKKYSARIVIIEFAYKSPHGLDFIVPLNKSGQSGQKAMEKLAHDKDYIVVAITACNLICVKKDLFIQLKTYLEKLGGAMPITSNILKPFKKDIITFIETGTYYGDGVVAALECGFEKIFSIEALKFRYHNCCLRFKNNNNVHLILGDSSKNFSLILKKLSSRALFWLDAHYSSGAEEKEFEMQPLISELKQIAQHPVKNHTILIDDRRLFTGKLIDWHNICEEEVIAELKKVNPNYNISFIDSPSFNSDIIVAEVEL